MGILNSNGLTTLCSKIQNDFTNIWAACKKTFVTKDTFNANNITTATIEEVTDKGNYLKLKNAAGTDLTSVSLSGIGGGGSGVANASEIVAGTLSLKYGGTGGNNLSDLLYTINNVNKLSVPINSGIDSPTSAFVFYGTVADSANFKLSTFLPNGGYCVLSNVSASLHDIWPLANGTAIVARYGTTSASVLTFINISCYNLVSGDTSVGTTYHYDSNNNKWIIIQGGSSEEDVGEDVGEDVIFQTDSDGYLTVTYNE